MATAHARSQSPIPGFVVIVLATAAILFGVAFVRKSKSAGDEVSRELEQLRQQYSAQAVALEAVERGIDDYAVFTSQVEFDVSTLRSSDKALEKRLKAMATEEPANPVIDEAALAAAVGKVQADAEARFQMQAEAMAELTAEIHALNERANQLEHELSQARSEAASSTAPQSAKAPSTESSAETSPSASQPTQAPQEEPKSTEAQDAGPPSGEAEEAAPESPTSAAAAEHAELLAPLFWVGFESQNGRCTTKARLSA